VKILGGPSMADGSDMKREPKIEKIKYQIVVLENIVKQMTDPLCQHGEKFDQMENEMGKLKRGFNESI
jgi:hypothetical protein